MLIYSGNTVREDDLALKSAQLEYSPIGGPYFRLTSQSLEMELQVDPEPPTGAWESSQADGSPVRRIVVSVEPEVSARTMSKI